MNTKYLTIALPIALIMSVVLSVALAEGNIGKTPKQVIKAYKKGLFDPSGYDAKDKIFLNCWTNYFRWKTNQQPVNCTDSDMRILIKWVLNKQGNTKSVLNILYSPIINETVIKGFEVLNQTQCGTIGGTYFGMKSISVTGETVPICEVFEASSTGGVTLNATRYEKNDKEHEKQEKEDKKHEDNSREKSYYHDYKKLVRGINELPNIMYFENLSQYIKAKGHYNETHEKYKEHTEKKEKDFE